MRAAFSFASNLFVGLSFAPERALRHAMLDARDIDSRCGRVAISASS